MSTKKRTTARKPAASPLAPKSLFQSLEIPEYGYWIGIAVLTAWYYYFSTVSTGFYQHDEISHYLGMKKFFDEPTSSLSVWAKPGYKILYAIPALLGLKFVFLVNCLVIATTAYICTLIAKELKMGNRLLAMLFFAAQPIILQVSFRCYSEVLVTLLIALLALFYYRKQFIAAALIMSYIFIVRFEMGLIAVIMAGIFLANRRWIPFLLLGTFPLLLNIVGWMVYGDPIWLINDVLLKGTKYQILQMGFFHYWRIFTPVIGALTTGFLLVSLFAFSSMDEFKEFYRKYHMLLILFLVSFFAYSLFSEPSFKLFQLGVQSRALMLISPPVAILAVAGFNRFFTGSKVTMGAGFAIMSVYALIVMTNLSLDYDHGIDLLPGTTENGHFMALGVAMALIGVAFVAKMKSHIATGVLAVVLVGYCMVVESPKELSPEDLLIRNEIVPWFKEQGLDEKETLCSHNVFYYHLDEYHSESGQFRKLQMKHFESAPPGTICLWESHYCYKPNYPSRDVPFEFIAPSGDPQKPREDLRFIRGFQTADRRFVLLAYEKIAP